MKVLAKKGTAVPFTIRLDPAAKAALDKVAASQGRPPANLAQWIVVEWLKANGALK